MSQDSWNPQQYDKFKDERSQPFFDLLQLIKKIDSPRVVDLGCGTGQLTKELHKHLKAKETIGLDSSESMLASARRLENEQLKFQKGPIESWCP